MQPILRWAGSKRQLLPKLTPFWGSSTGRYIEPFCGSACLFFELEPKKAILGDLNGELIVTYRTLQRDAGLVAQCLSRLHRGESAYYRIRDTDPDGLSEAEVAARFLYLNRFCFNGIYRTNLKGRFNVPYGKQKTLPKHDIANLVRGAELLKNATLLKWSKKYSYIFYNPPQLTYFLDALLACRDRGLPIKLFIAVRKGHQDTDYAQKLKAAKRAGVGILEVDDKSGDILQNALSLSLTGVRLVEVATFPKKFRQNLLQAEQAFRDGNPAKACSMIYDEIENYFRKVAQKAEKKGWWANKGKLKLQKDAWANIITELDRCIDRAACGCPDLTPAFMARILGVTPFRNETGHKPGSAKAVVKRDKELRTRFESAVDLLADLIRATRTMHL